MGDGYFFTVIVVHQWNIFNIVEHETGEDILLLNDSARDAADYTHENKYNITITINDIILSICNNY